MFHIFSVILNVLNGPKILKSEFRSPRKEKYDPIVIRSRSNSPDIKPDIRHRPAEVPERRVTITKKPAEPDVQVVEPDKSAYSRLFQKSKVRKNFRKKMVNSKYFYDRFIMNSPNSTVSNTILYSGTRKRAAKNERGR